MIPDCSPAPLHLSPPHHGIPFPLSSSKTLLTRRNEARYSLNVLFKTWFDMEKEDGWPGQRDGLKEGTPARQRGPVRYGDGTM